MRAPAREGRLPTQLRPIEVTTGYLPHAEGSALVTWGGTRVVATVTIENKLPPHLRGGGVKGGWLTAEYALLPRSTVERTPRERLYASGRTQEVSVPLAYFFSFLSRNLSLKAVVISLARASNSAASASFPIWRAYPAMRFRSWMK